MGFFKFLPKPGRGVWFLGPGLPKARLAGGERASGNCRQKTVTVASGKYWRREASRHGLSRNLKKFKGGQWSATGFKSGKGVGERSCKPGGLLKNYHYIQGYQNVKGVLEAGFGESVGETPAETGWWAVGPLEPWFAYPILGSIKSERHPGEPDSECHQTKSKLTLVRERKRSEKRSSKHADKEGKTGSRPREIVLNTGRGTQGWSFERAESAQ